VAPRPAPPAIPSATRPSGAPDPAANRERTAEPTSNQRPGAARSPEAQSEVPDNAADPTLAMRVLPPPPQERPARPAPVVAAMVLVNLTGVGLFGLSLLFATLGPAVFFVPLVAAVMMGWLGRGIWRGSRGAYVITMTIAVLVALAGIASVGGSASLLLTGLQLVVPATLIALLTAQATTRRYFWGR